MRTFELGGRTLITGDAWELTLVELHGAHTFVLRAVDAAEEQDEVRVAILAFSGAELRELATLVENALSVAPALLATTQLRVVDGDRS